ncbi:MAG: hypothetical protein R2688_05890 [Fimbriimonadaceae bacterium]
MKRFWVIACSLLALFSLAAACEWDSDTLAQELRGMPDILGVIAGRFDRNPPLYYEMRLDRVSKEIGSGAKDLELFDDAGVACDKLGRPDEAIDWMEKKRAVLDGLNAPDSEHEYRYYANLGTFYVHRWFKTQNRADLSDLKKGLAHLERGIEINPDAHFGREKVQVALIKHMIWEFSGAEGTMPAVGVSKEGMREGLIGIIVLGGAWESPDAWNWLMGTFPFEDSHIQYMIKWRVEGLVESGKERMLERTPDLLDDGYSMPEDEKETRTYYDSLRKNGEEFQRNRESFMMARLEAGKHPDTSQDFWDGYVETPPIGTPKEVPMRQVRNEAMFSGLYIGIFVGIVIGTFVALGIVVVVALIRKKRAAAQ